MSLPEKPRESDGRRFEPSEDGVPGVAVDRRINLRRQSEASRTKNVRSASQLTAPQQPMWWAACDSSYAAAVAPQQSESPEGVERVFHVGGLVPGGGSKTSLRKFRRLQDELFHSTRCTSIVTSLASRSMQVR